jgi:ribosomal protein S18 acetylase RimI-like enzyme
LLIRVTPRQLRDLTPPRANFVLRIVDSPELVGIARTLMGEYAALPHTKGRWTTSAADIASLPEPYVLPAGILLVAVRPLPSQPDDASALGCGGLLALDTPGAAEIKRVYVRPGARGEGIGEAITRELVRHAGSLGFARVRLDTAPELHNAIRLYERLGFTHIPPYKAGLLPDAVCMELPIANAASAPLVRRAVGGGPDDAVGKARDLP